MTCYCNECKRIYEVNTDCPYCKPHDLSPLGIELYQALKGLIIDYTTLSDTHPTDRVLRYRLTRAEKALAKAEEIIHQ
jgi:hypothetical protein